MFLLKVQLVMRVLVVFSLLMVLLSSCQSKSNQDLEAGAVLDLSTLQLPMELSDHGKIVFGNPQDAKTCMVYNKRISEGNMDFEEILADTVTWYFPDGSTGTATRDSVTNFIRMWRDGQSKVEFNYINVVPLKNIDTHEEWVMAWMFEKITDINDTVRTNYFHQDYYMENGKIRTIYQYSRKPTLNGN